MSNTESLMDAYQQIATLKTEVLLLQTYNARLRAMAEADAFEIGRVKEENIRLEAELKAVKAESRHSSPMEERP